MSELNYKIFEPSEEVTRPDGLIVVSNEIISSMDDYLGTKAQTLANTLGTMVLAYERQHSASNLVFSGAVRNHVYENAASISVDTAHKLDKAITLEGTKEIDVVGHSAAATEAVLLARTNVLGICRLFVTDPVGVRITTPIKGEIIEFGGYNFVTERKKGERDEKIFVPNNPLIVPVSAKEKAKRIAQELMTFSRLWRSEVALDALIDLSMSPDSPATRVIFPGKTFNANEETLRFVSMVVNATSDEFGTRVESSVESDRYHSDFSNHAYFGARYEESI